MGQLEKYGLYVLCLVIFLILGVAIWGGDPAPSSGSKQLPLAGNPSPRVRPGTGPDLAGNIVRRDAARVPAASGDEAIRKLLQQAELPPTPRPQPAEPPAKDPGPTEAGGESAAKEGQPKPPAADATRPRYTIQKDDTFEDIAKQQLGGISYVEDIKRLNPGLDPTRLKIGKEIVLPSKADLQSRKAAEASAAKVASATAEADSGTGEWRYYKVQRDDTYEGIARKMFHDARKAEAIQKLNPTLDPRRLRPGMDIRIPVR